MFIIHDWLHHLNHYHHNPIFFILSITKYTCLVYLTFKFSSTSSNILIISVIFMQSFHLSSFHSPFVHPFMAQTLEPFVFTTQMAGCWMLIPAFQAGSRGVSRPIPISFLGWFFSGFKETSPGTHLFSGWWLAYPSEKWWSESQLGWLFNSQLNGKSIQIPWFPTTKQFWQFTINTKRQHSLISSQRSTQSQYPYSQCISKILSSWPSDRILTEIEVTKVKWPVQWTNKTYVDHQRTIFKHIVYQCLSTKIILKSSPTSSNMELFRPNDAASGHRWDSCASQPARCRSPSWPSWMSRPFFCKASRWAPRVMSKPVIYMYI